MKRKSLTTAVIAGLTGVAGMVGVSNAVNLNPDGLGQVLLYPYYSARGGNDTLISVVNTTADAKSVKVRFLEGLNSREVLDFNLYLSAFDVWAAAITVDDDGTGGRLIIGDSSCTVPYFYGAGTFEDENDRFGTVDFLNFAYTGDFADGATGDIERTESGYLEMIEMGVLTDVDFGSATAATHIPTEFGPRPLDCAQLVEAWTTDTTGGSNTYWNPADDGAGDPNFDHDVPAGGLFGGAAIINVEEGVMFSYNAEAIDAFSSSILHTSPGSLEPDLNSGDNTSNVFIGGTVDTQTWPTGVEAVSATVLYNELMNEYVTNPALNAMSEWVVTFPTKRFYVDPLFAIGTAPVPPFTSVFDGTACEQIDFVFWDREEAPEEVPVIPPIVSPPPPPGTGPDGFELCYESNVVRFAGSSDIPDESEILKEPRFTTFPVSDAGFISGWTRFDFGATGSGHVTRSSAAGVQYLGLPAIGFWVNTYTNGAMGDGVLANYGGTFRHRGSRALQLAPTP